MVSSHGMRGGRGAGNHVARFGTSISSPGSSAHARAPLQPLAQLLPKRASGPSAIKEKFCAVLR
eukprot:14716027-Alexandrium_andersonii.AAC.1